MGFRVDLQHLSFGSKIPLLIMILLTPFSIVVACYYYYKLKALQIQDKKLPPGSFGYPLLGESISFARAMKSDKLVEWMQSRVRKYGPIFKTSLLGSKVVVMTGQAGNRLVFSGGHNGITFQQPKAVARILGKNSLFELSGSLHKLIRGAVVESLNPESVQMFVSEMDSLVQRHLLKELDGKDSVKIVELMKKISFDAACSIFFGISDGKEKEMLLKDYTMMVKGVWTIPLNVPGTVLHRALQARARICKRLSNVINIKKRQMEEGKLNSQDKIITRLLDLRDENGEPLQEELILNIFLALLLASHDTSAILMTFLLRHLTKDPEAHDKVLQEQMEVVKAKRGSNGELSWNEIKMMEYTWKVAQEILRIHPPLFGNFRLTTRDISFDGFYIPKGWQLLWVASGTHMDNNIFEDPNKIDPSRFDASYKAFPRFTYVPFGAGPRVCPGAEFAKIESLVVIHHLITKYKWTEMIPDEPITNAPAHYPAMGLPVKLHPIHGSNLSGHSLES